MTEFFILLFISTNSHNFYDNLGANHCSFCHNSHNSSGPYLLGIKPYSENEEIMKGMDYVSLTCMNCHTKKSTLLELYPEVKKFYYIIDTSLIFLETSFGDDHPLREAITEEGENLFIKCTSCHTPHKSNFPYLLKQQTNTLCEGCHKNHSLYSGKHSKLTCSNCHTAHFAEIEPLLRRTVCVQCHSGAGSRPTRELSIQFFIPMPSDITHSTNNNCILCHNPHTP